MAAGYSDSDMLPLICDNDRTDDDETLYEFRINGVTIHYENLRSEYTKVHKKIPRRFKQGKGSWMRVENGVVSIGIDVNAAAYSGSFVAKVVVQRDRKAYEETLRMNDGQSKYLGGEVNLNYNCTQEGTTKWKLNLDLDSVYAAEENGIVKEVYALCPSNIYVTNKFQLVTELYVREDTCGYGDRLICKKRSQPFLLRTPQRSPPYPSLQDPTPPVSISPVPIPEAPDGIFNILSANTASIDTLEAHVIKTRRRDIGYHIPLKDYSQKGELDEGDVVGFFEDEYEKTVIERLSKENYDRAKLAGVITRSYYVAGLCSDSQMDNSDLVCVIGIVKVRVLGPVRNGDQLYAYKKRPGVAATRTRLLLEKREENDKTFLIGQAIESKNGVQYNEETLVSAFVSVVNGIDCLAMNQRVESLDKNLKGMIQSLVYDATKKIKRRFFWLKALLLVAMLAVGIALWQRYAPNTLLRESMCKRGSYKENKMPLRYNTSWEEIKMTGLEFKFKDLHEKIYHKEDLKPRSGRPGNFRYFINFERCKNRGVSYGNKYVDNTLTASGPEILSSDVHCTPKSVKYLNDGRWVKLMKYRRRITISHCPPV